MYYHMLANQAKNKRDVIINNKEISYEAQKVWLWFPLFSFFESGIDGKIPNEFAWPITMHDVNETIKHFKELSQTLFHVGKTDDVQPEVKTETSKRNGFKKKFKTK